MDFRFFLGVDLGQAQDPTAMALLEQKLVPIANDQINPHKGEVKCITRYHNRFLERVPLDTPYTDVADRIKVLMHMPELKDETVLLVDATGVGRPVVDMLRAKGLMPVAITIHGGAELSVAQDGYHVPKRQLVSALLLLFQSHRLSLSPKLALSQLLAKELQNFTQRISNKGKDTYEAWRESEHDDLVLALSMAAWYATQSEPWEKKISRFGQPKGRTDWDPLNPDLPDDGLDRDFNQFRFGQFRK